MALYLVIFIRDAEEIVNDASEINVNGCLPGYLYNNAMV